MFANLSTLGYVAVASENKRLVLDKWQLQDFKPFYPMALDAMNHRLFIGSRNPARLVILDTATGKIVTSVEGVGHTDDLWYDAAHKQAATELGFALRTSRPAARNASGWSRIAPAKSDRVESCGAGGLPSPAWGAGSQARPTVTDHPDAVSDDQCERTGRHHRRAGTTASA